MTGRVRQQGIVWPLLDYSQDHLKIAQQVPAIAQLCLQTSILRFGRGVGRSDHVGAAPAASA